MTEQEATDRLEQLVGSIPRCFRLMELYKSSQMQATANKFNFRKVQHTVEQIFQKKATEAGFTAEVILFYLNNIR
jgi:hypothetical protein